MTVAASLVALSAALVLGAVALDNSVLVVLAAIASVGLGASAVKIIHAELVQTRRDAARDRALQAQAYRDITARRTAENVAFAQDMKARIAEREELIGHLEVELGKALERAATATLKMNSEARRADFFQEENARLATAMDAADSRAAEAIVRVAELEAELDTLRAELEAWQITAEESARKLA